MGPALADALPGIVRMQDEPLADPAAIATFFICQFAARFVRGRPHRRECRRGARWLPTLWLAPGRRAAAALAGRDVGGRHAAPGLPHGVRDARIARADEHAPRLGVARAPTPRLGGGDERRHAARAGGAAGLGAADAALVERLHHGGGNPVHELMYLDFKTWLPDDVLVKTDRMSMAVSVEARVPFLDHRLVEFAASLPSTVKVQDLATKALLRRAMRHDLPARTLRRHKRAFLVPLRRWLDGELRDMVVDTLTASAARSRGLFSQTATARLLDEQRRGREDHSRALWTLLTLELWLRNVLDASAAAHD